MDMESTAWSAIAGFLARLAVEGTLQLDPLVSCVYDPRTPAEAYRDLQENGERILGAVFDWSLGSDG